jgi:septal ring factor EnvC (AmiA/AmiB activator)
MKRLVIIALLLIAAPAVAQQDETARLRAEIARYEAEIKSCNDLIAKAKKDQTISEGELKITRTQLAKRREMITSLGKQVNAIEKEIYGRRGDISRLERDMKALRGEYADMVYAAWKNHKHNDFLLFLFSAPDFNAATRRADFMRRYNRARQEKAAQIAALAEEMHVKVSALDATRAELDATRQTQNREASTLAADEKQYTSKVQQLAADQKGLQKQIAEKQALRQKAQAQIDEIIAAEIRRAREATMSDADQRALAALSGRFDQNRGKLPHPISGGVIIDKFGKHPHPLDPKLSVNNPGINIAGPGGAAARCVFEGEVMATGTSTGYNKFVLVRHGNYITLYANLVSTSVRQGAKVDAGQTVGRIDNSSNTDNNFLHFEVNNMASGEAQPLNPELWLRK